ncbi:MAG: hypothetical protein EAZ43_02135 [Betaproteobacteria bacterium]|nr:MAG: hypothetical protein EAZ43_02135 [Betaproteobacteria bacterium]
MNRFRASLLHFMISAAVGMLLLSLVWFVYYPSPLLVGLGGLEIFLLIIFVDVILGPLLTLVVFDVRKKSLRFDLAAIATLQLVALCYGATQLFAARPAYIAALDNELQVIQATEIPDQLLEKTSTSLPLFGPRWVGTVMPTDRLQLEEVTLVTQMADGGAGHFPQYHSDISSNTNQLLAVARAVDELTAIHEIDSSRVDDWLANQGVSREDAVFVPAKIQADRYAAIVSRRERKIVGITPFMLRQ